MRKWDPFTTAFHMSVKRASSIRVSLTLDAVSFSNQGEGESSLVSIQVSGEAIS